MHYETHHRILLVRTAFGDHDRYGYEDFIRKSLATCLVKEDPVAVEEVEKECRRYALVAVEETVVLHDKVQEVRGLLFNRGIGLLTSEARIDVTDGRAKRVVLLHVET